MTINASLDEPTAIQYEIWEQMKRLIEKGNRYFPNMTVDWIKLNARADPSCAGFLSAGFHYELRILKDNSVFLRYYVPRQSTQLYRADGSIVDYTKTESIPDSLRDRLVKDKLTPLFIRILDEINLREPITVV